MSYTAGEVMNSAAALLNDVSLTLYTHTTQLPHLKIAQQELEDELTLNDCPINLISEAEISVAANVTSLALPASFFLPISLQEKGSSDVGYYPMKEMGDINIQSNTVGVSLGIWDFRHNCINLVGANNARTVRLIYWRTLPEVLDANSVIAVRRAKNALSFRTAALCSEFIGGAAGKGRADSLNLQYLDSRDRLVAMLVKNNQGIRVRRKPFRMAR